MYLNNNKLKQVFFLASLIILGAFLFWLLKGFVSAVLGAIVFYILLRIPLFYLTQKTKLKWNNTLATVVLIIVSFLVLVLPVLLVSLMLSGKVSYLISHYSDILSMASDFSEKAKRYLGVDLLSADTVNKLTGIAADVVPKFITATANVLVDIFVMYFLLYFMLSNARTMEKNVRKNLPFTESNDVLVLRELRNQTISNSIGVAILAVLQGIIAWLGYSIFGVDQPFFWAVITAITSVLPVVGAGIVWVPVSVFLYASGHTWQGLALLIYCAVIITSVDNIFRFVVLKKFGNVHPIITFFGVIIGLDLFGFVGVIFGPLLISYFILFLKIYRNEYLGVPHQAQNK